MVVVLRVVVVGVAVVVVVALVVMVMIIAMVSIVALAPLNLVEIVILQMEKMFVRSKVILITLGHEESKC